MSTLVKNMLSGGGVSLEDWLGFELTLDILAASSSNIAANPSAYTGLLNKTVEAAVNGETLEYEIIDLARYDKSDGSGKAGCVLMPKYLLSTRYKMNSSPTSSGGWGRSELRTWLNGLSRPSQAVQVKIPYAATKNAPPASYSDDYLFLPAYGELCGRDPQYLYSEGDIFAGVVNSDDWRKRSIRGTGVVQYWSRSLYVYNSSSIIYYYWYVSSTGALNGGYGESSSTYGVLPCFCI